MIAMVFFAIPYMASNKTFLVVDLADLFFGNNKKLHDKMLLIGNFISLALVIYLIFPCIHIARNSTHIFSTALRLPMSYMYALMPMSFIFSAVAIAKNLLKHVVIDRHLPGPREVG
jgi:TRAP-type C4-dicarboxylate transport system permease small subunit